MSAVQVESQTTETIYITLRGLDKKIKVSNPDNIPNLKDVLERKWPAILHAGWNHSIDKVFVNQSLAEFHISWFDPSDKGGLSLFLCGNLTNTKGSCDPIYGLAVYSSGEYDTNETVLEIKSVNETNCFPR